ncbi:MAG: hypothetical protein R3229_16555 [Alphaproteobacteria bacterium]|nr:hypothetical protein [Alphaproteobacteria bacterium]
MTRFHGKRPEIAAHYAKYPVPLAAIAPFTAEEAAGAYALMKDAHNIDTYGESDKAYPSAVCYYRAPFLGDYAARVKRHIRPYLDYDIVETYWYARLYGMGDKLDMHVDRGACFVSVSVCFGYDFNDLFPAGSAWPLFTQSAGADGAAQDVPFDLQPGGGMLYPGCWAPHWRDVFLGERCGQAFFHFVPDDAAVFGEYFGDTDKGRGAR